MNNRILEKFTLDQIAQSTSSPVYLCPSMLGRVNRFPSTKNQWQNARISKRAYKFQSPSDIPARLIHRTAQTYKILAETIKENPHITTSISTVDNYQEFIDHLENVFNHLGGHKKNNKKKMQLFGESIKYAKDIHHHLKMRSENIPRIELESVEIFAQTLQDSELYISKDNNYIKNSPKECKGNHQSKLIATAAISCIRRDLPHATIVTNDNNVVNYARNIIGLFEGNLNLKTFIQDMEGTNDLTNPTYSKTLPYIIE